MLQIQTASFFFNLINSICAIIKFPITLFFTRAKIKKQQATKQADQLGQMFLAKNKGQKPKANLCLLSPIVLPGKKGSFYSFCFLLFLQLLRPLSFWHLVGFIPQIFSLFLCTWPLCLEGRRPQFFGAERATCPHAFCFFCFAPGH